MALKDRSTNDQVECASCHFRTATEDFYEFGGAIYCQRCFAEIESKRSKKIRTAILFTVAGVTILSAGLLGWYFFLRDTWEADHRSQITSMIDDGRALEQEGNLAGAKAKLDDVQRLVASHRIKDEALRTLVEEGRSEALEIDRKLVVQDLPKRLQKAADSLNADKLEQARESYNSVIDAVNAKGPPSAEMTRAADRAKEGIAMVNQRQEKLTADRAQQEADRVAEERQRTNAAALAKQQQDEEARLAKIQSSVSGGAWVTKGGGQSDLLRGMKVYLLKPECSSKILVSFYQSTADSAIKQSGDRRKTATTFTYPEYVNEYNDAAKALDSYAVKMREQTKQVPDKTISLQDCYRAMRLALRQNPEVTRLHMGELPVAEDFAGILSECTERSVQANIDGKFSFEKVPGGKHFLYAYWTTSFSHIEWLIAIDVKDGTPVVQDLFNETAEIIWNKPTN